MAIEISPQSVNPKPVAGATARSRPNTVSISTTVSAQATVSNAQAATRVALPNSQPSVKVDSRADATPLQTGQAIAAIEAKKLQQRQQVARESNHQVESQVESIVRQLNQTSQQVQRKLEFTVDEITGRTIIKVRDRETGEVVREIPSEEIVRLGQRLKELAESLQGVTTTGNGTELGKGLLAGLLVQRQA